MNYWIVQVVQLLEDTFGWGTQRTTVIRQLDKMTYFLVAQYFSHNITFNIFCNRFIQLNRVTPSLNIYICNYIWTYTYTNTHENTHKNTHEYIYAYVNIYHRYLNDCIGCHRKVNNFQDWANRIQDSGFQWTLLSSAFADSKDLFSVLNQIIWLFQSEYSMDKDGSL